MILFFSISVSFKFELHGNWKSKYLWSSETGKWRRWHGCRLIQVRPWEWPWKRPWRWWAMATHLLELSETTSASCQKRSRSRKGNSSMSLQLFSKKSWPWSTTRANQTKTLWSWPAYTMTRGLTLWQTLYVSTMPQGGLSMPWIKWHMRSQPKGSQNDGPWSFFSTWSTSVPLLHV